MDQRQQEILNRLQFHYPEVHCQLTHETPFQLAVAVILSAQCTDKRVNMVTPKLFSFAKTPEDFVNLPLDVLEELIRSTGFFRNKAKNIKAFAKIVQEQFGGSLPESLNELIKLPGIGRKTGNVVQQEAFAKVEGVVMDTHAIRVSYRLGFTKASKNPQKQERELMALLPKEYWYRFTHWMILHGRAICIARKPKCSSCFLQDVCPRKGVVVLG